MQTASDIRPALNSLYPVDTFTGFPCALYDLGARQIAIFECDPDTGAQTLYDILPHPYNPSIENYSTYICVGLISAAYPYNLI